MAKVETNTCDSPGCDRVAHGTCVLCQKDGCKEHLTGALRVSFHTESQGGDHRRGPSDDLSGMLTGMIDPIGNVVLPIASTEPVYCRVNACSRCAIFAGADTGTDRAAIKKALAEAFDKILEELRVGHAAAALSAEPVGPQAPLGPQPYVGATAGIGNAALAAQFLKHAPAAQKALVAQQFHSFNFPIVIRAPGTVTMKIKSFFSSKNKP